ncbi:hypothetical protein [uncultured Pontibacter sp.]|uniref:hypothetical protein n=1 Tax=uncultured Pontibacter sp. TaxID=453356 RepID=UPI002623C16F|nr:hypothetical protein [uncultured Pontibacter sp.]
MEKEAIDIDRSNKLQDIFNNNAWVTFLLCCLVGSIILYVQQNFVRTEEVYFNTYGDQLTLERISELIQVQKKWHYLSHLLIPLSYLLQISLVVVCVSIGFALNGLKVEFKKLYAIVTNATIVFLIGKALNLLILLVIGINRLDDELNLDKFSLLGLIGKSNVDELLWYPLWLLNMFEILFMLLLAVGLCYNYSMNFRKSIGLVISTYGLGLLVWIMFVLFFQLTYS